MSRTPGNKTFTFVVAVNAPADLETVVMQYVNSAMRRYVDTSASFNEMRIEVLVAPTSMAWMFRTQ